MVNIGYRKREIAIQRGRAALDEYRSLRDPKTKRPVGRPAGSVKADAKKMVSVRLPVEVVDYLKSCNESQGAHIERLIRAEMGAA